MLLSVIIPVYGVETTLDRCVESVLGQRMSDMEVILVDDGSPDRCPQMCDEWAQRDSRIKVIHKENGGLSDARNAGLDIATGDFLTFVDSDDWIDDGLYSQLLQQMGDNDLQEYSIADRLQLKDDLYDDTRHGSYQVAGGLDTLDGTKLLTGGDLIVHLGHINIGDDTQGVLGIVADTDVTYFSFYAYVLM